MYIKHPFLVSALAVAICTGLTIEPSRADKQATMNSFWWPEQVDLTPLRQNAAESNPLGKSFRYGEAFKTLDLMAVKADIAATLQTSQPWWPRTTAITDPSSSGWPGTARGFTAPLMDAAALPVDSNVSSHSIVGRITPIWTRRGVCYGRSRRYTAASCPGPI